MGQAASSSREIDLRLERDNEGARQRAEHLKLPPLEYLFGPKSKRRGVIGTLAIAEAADGMPKHTHRRDVYVRRLTRKHTGTSWDAKTRVPSPEAVASKAQRDKRKKRL